MRLGRRFFTVSGLTIISRIFGIVREAAFSHFLGAGTEMDTFLVAFKFPSFFRKFFAEGGFQSIFVPYYTDYYASGKNKASQYFSSRIFTIIFWITVSLAFIVFIFAKEFAVLMAPGFCADPEKLALATEFTRIIFPSIVFISLSAVYSGILIADNQFFAFAVSPILVNIVLISSLLFGENFLSAGRRISYGLLLAGIIQFCCFYVYLKYRKIATPLFSRIKITNKTKQFFKKLLPILAGAGVAQINVFIDSLFGSILPTGTISYIYFADRFIQFPLALFGISMGVILLPEISRKMAKCETNCVNDIQNEALSFTLRMTFPAVIGLISLAYFLISILYGHGKFSEISVQKTASILRIFAIGLPAYVAAKIMAFVLFAQKDSKTPIIAALVSIAANSILSLILMGPFQEFGLAIATSISGFINLYIMYRKSYPSAIIVISEFKKILIASIIMLFFIEILKLLLLRSGHDTFLQAISIVVICVTGIVVYIASLFFLKDEVARSWLKKLRKRLKSDC
ncbi:MAG: murein biosynthesis integral membrane protein MurJ [Holosporales bacterium]|jgi:putative peptidoglycan lipid II flippase|nr:murein biosynthesis integral membrane protein MurJ [Holosporales bacterium]